MDCSGTGLPSDTESPGPRQADTGITPTDLALALNTPVGPSLLLPPDSFPRRTPNPRDELVGDVFFDPSLQCAPGDGKSTLECVLPTGKWIVNDVKPRSVDVACSDCGDSIDANGSGSPLIDPITRPRFVFDNVPGLDPFGLGPSLIIPSRGRGKKGKGSTGSSIVVAATTNGSGRDDPMKWTEKDPPKPKDDDDPMKWTEDDPMKWNENTRLATVPEAASMGLVALDLAAMAIVAHKRSRRD